jgi:hypothetical protein
MPLLEAREVDDRWVSTLPSAAVTVSSDLVFASAPASLPMDLSEIKTEPSMLDLDVEVIEGVGPVCGGCLRTRGQDCE